MPTGNLARNPNDKWIAGVCSGIARWLGWNPDGVRILYVVVTGFTGVLPGIVVYVVLGAIMPVED